MKRSELNTIIEEAITFVEEKGLCFPAFAKWGLPEWKAMGPEYQEITDNMLGWDISDFGSGDFNSCGLLIFTFRETASCGRRPGTSLSFSLEQDGRHHQQGRRQSHRTAL